VSCTTGALLKASSATFSSKHGVTVHGVGNEPQQGATAMSTSTPINESESSPTTDKVQTVPDAVVAVYTTEEELSRAVKLLEREHFDMSSISVLGKGMSEQRHVIGFDTPEKRTARWAKWGGLWGWVFGALLFVPGVGHVAIGGYLLFVLMTTGVGAAGGALGGALSSVGIPKEGIPVYEADLRADRYLVIAHGSAEQVETARALLDQTNHDRLDHHHNEPHNPGL
jgi:uncharacterized membrane protein